MDEWGDDCRLQRQPTEEKARVNKQGLIELIREGFAETHHPGDSFLLGSREGEDGAEAIEPFLGIADWAALDSTILYDHYDALSFLSEGGFRYFLPAYLVADINDQLRTADVVFHLAGAFLDATVDIGNVAFEKRIGRSAFVNPLRYGAMTFEDYSRFRLSVFTREEAAAIVAFLEYRRELPDALDGDTIEAALDLFWRERMQTAPTVARLLDHTRSEEEFMRRISIRLDDETGD